MKRINTNTMDLEKKIKLEQELSDWSIKVYNKSLSYEQGQQIRCELEYYTNDFLKNSDLIDEHENKILSYVKTLDWIMDNFIDSKILRDILDLNGKLLSNNKFDYSSRINNLVLRNLDSSNLEHYLTLPIKAIWNEGRTTVWRDFLKKTLLVLEKYESEDFNDSILSSLDLILSFDDELRAGDMFEYEYVPLLLDSELEPQNKKEALLYDYIIKDNLGQTNLIQLIYDSRDYNNIKKIEIEPFQHYCLNIKNLIHSDYKYSLNMGQIKTLIKTYDLVTSYLDNHTKEASFGKVKLGKYWTEILEMEGTEQEKQTNLMSFCYDVERMMKSGAYDDDLRLMFAGGGRE